MAFVRALTKALLSSLLLLNIALAAMPADYEPYSVRPDISTVQDKAHPELGENWQKLRQAHVEAIAQLIESYPDRELYFLARDGEYLYDLAKTMLKDEPDALKRIHLLNISRANMRADHVKDYLAQEGISEATLKAGKKVIFVDTGFSGTIPRAIQEKFPSELHPQLQTHLICSSNKEHPSSRVFLSVINPAVVENSPGSMHGTIITYEHMPRYTDRSDRFEKVGDRWEPASRIGGAEDGTVSTEKATAYREDIANYAATKDARDLLKKRRLLWRQLEKLRQTGQTEQLKKTLKALVSSRETLDPAEKTQREAIVRDFVEMATLNGKQTPLDVQEFGLRPSQAPTDNKFSLIKKYPQWAKILQNPATEIPKLFAAGDYATLGAMVDVVADIEFSVIVTQNAGKTDPSKSPIALKFIESQINNPKMDTFILEYVLTQPQWATHPELVEKLLDAGSLFDSYIAMYIIGSPLWKDHPEWAERLINKGTVDPILARALGQPHWQTHTQLFEKLVAAGKSDPAICENILSNPYFENHPEWVETILARRKADVELVKSVLNQPHWRNHPEWIERILERKSASFYVAQNILSQPWAAEHPEWVETLFFEPRFDSVMAELVLSQEHWKNHPEFVEHLVQKGTVDTYLAVYVLGKPHWKGHPEWIETVMKRGLADEHLLAQVPMEEHWKKHPEWVDRLIASKKIDYLIARNILTSPYSAEHPEWVEALVKSAHAKGQLDEALRMDHWKDHPVLRGLCDGKLPTFERLTKAYKSDECLKNGLKSLF